MVLVNLDEPKSTEETWGYATAGWNAAPTGGRIIERIAPVLGVEPIDPERPDIRRALHVDFIKRERRLASF